MKCSFGSQEEILSFKGTPTLWVEFTQVSRRGEAFRVNTDFKSLKQKKALGIHSLCYREKQEQRECDTWLRRSATPCLDSNLLAWP